MAWLTLEGTRNGRDLFAVTVLIESPEIDPYMEARKKAIKDLGERYVCSKTRHVPCGHYEMKEAHGADVATTWERARKKMETVISILSI